MQKNRLADLIEYEFAVRRAVRRRQAFGAARDLNRIGVDHSDALQEFAEAQIKTIIETPDDGRVAPVFFAGGVEVEEFFQMVRLFLF
jgi:hypothetical protein